jgi:hypothetical protein
MEVWSDAAVELQCGFGRNVDVLDLYIGVVCYAFMSHVDRWYARL